MREFLQTMILPVIGALIGGQIAVIRTGKLRKDIRENINLLGQLPADHPSRARLEGNIGELVDTLVRRQQRRYGPFTQAGVSFGAYAGVAAVSLAFAFFGLLLAAGVIPSASASDPPDSGDGWAGAVFFLVMAAGFTVAAVRAVRRQLREHPAQLERNLGTSSIQPQPSEAG
jgi:hypothetical protein